MSRKAGRPRVPKHKAKVPGVSVRLTLAERKIIDDAVKRSGLTQTEFCKKSLLFIAQRDICIT